MEHRSPVVGLSDRAGLPSAKLRLRLERRARQGGGFVHRLAAAALRDCEMTGDASAALADAGRTAVDDRAAAVEIDHRPLPADLRAFALEDDIADQRDQLAVEVVDARTAPLAVSDGLRTVTPPLASSRLIWTPPLLE